MIYDLIEQILDPCGFITSEMESTDDLYTVADSIITQNVAIYHSYVLTRFFSMKCVYYYVYY